VLRCSRCGKFVDWAEARVQTVCSCRPHIDLPPVIDLVTRRRGATRVVLATTNDPLPALYFYQRRGYRVVEVVPDAWREHAELTIGVGFAGIPVLDELRLDKAI